VTNFVQKSWYVFCSRKWEKVKMNTV
jgi:hypothetical protein